MGSVAQPYQIGAKEKAIFNGTCVPAPLELLWLVTPTFEYYCKFGNIIVLSGLGFKNLHKSHVLAYEAIETDLNIVQSAMNNFFVYYTNNTPLSSSVCVSFWAFYLPCCHNMVTELLLYGYD